jgi:hypothetical protein
VSAAPLLPATPGERVLAAAAERLDDRGLERAFGHRLALRAIFGEMAKAYVPRVANGFIGEIQYDLRRGSGATTSFTIKCADARAFARPGAGRQPALTVRLALADFLRMAAGQLDQVELLTRLSWRSSDEPHRTRLQAGTRPARHPRPREVAVVLPRPGRSGPRRHRRRRPPVPAPGNEHEHHSLVLREGPTGIDHFAFRAASAEHLTALAADLRAHGHVVEEVAAGAELGQGDAIRFVSPQGHAYEVYWDMERGRQDSRLLNRKGKAYLRGFSPMHLDHINIACVDVAAGEAFLADRVGFLRREYVQPTDGPVVA